MKKFRSIPALMTLIAGFITSVIMIIHKYSLVHFLWTLVAVMAGFYIAGMLLIFILNKVFKDKKENEENFNAFIKVLARLVQKYGPTVLEEIKKEEEGQYEQRR